MDDLSLFSQLEALIRASTSSKEEGQLVQVHVRGDVANLRPVNGDLVSQHARSRDLDRVSPVIVVVAQSVGEVQDGVLRDL